MVKIRFIPPTRSNTQVKEKRMSPVQEITVHLKSSNIKNSSSVKKPNEDVYKFTSEPTIPMKVPSISHQKRMERKVKKAKIMKTVLKDIFRMKEDIAELRKRKNCTKSEP